MYVGILLFFENKISLVQNLLQCWILNKRPLGWNLIKRALLRVVQKTFVSRLLFWVEFRDIFHRLIDEFHNIFPRPIDEFRGSAFDKLTKFRITPTAVRLKKFVVFCDRLINFQNFLLNRSTNFAISWFSPLNL